MADPWGNDDEEMVDIPLSEPSSDSIVNEKGETRSPLSQSSGPAQPISDLVVESSPANEATLTTETPTAAQTGITSHAESATDSSELPPGQGNTFVHPISEGGIVSWTNHDDLVFRQGKERGPRVPAPSLPGDYQSGGPLPKFDFKRLRENNPKKEAVTEFLENYAGKQKQVPIELVSEMKAYYDENEDSRLKYLAGRSLTIQELNDTIKLQDREIATLKEENAEAGAIKIFDAKRGEKIKELCQNIKQKEDTIKKLENTIAKQNQELEDLSRVSQQEEIKKLRKDDREKDEVINELLLKIHDLEINTDEQMEEVSDSEDMALTVGNKSLDEILVEIKRKRDAYNKQKEAGASDRIPSKGSLIKQANEIKDIVTESTVRCLLIQGNRYVDNYEASAALEIFERAEEIVARDLPGYNILQGKVLCQKGRALYELRTWRDAVTAFETAINLGFVSGCGELDCDSAERFLPKARKGLRRSTDLSWNPRHRKPQ